MSVATCNPGGTEDHDVRRQAQRFAGRRDLEVNLRVGASEELSSCVIELQFHLQGARGRIQRVSCTHPPLLRTACPDAREVQSGLQS